MTKETKLTLEERGAISQMMKSHHEWSGKQIAREILRSKTCGNNYMKNPKEYGKSKRCGILKTTTGRDERIIFRKARLEKFFSRNC